jgi:hypothetical protein
LVPTGRQVFLAPLNDLAGEPADEPLAVPMGSNFIRLGDLEGFIQPDVGQRTLSLSDSQD